MTKITLELDDDLYRELEVAARDRGEEVAQTARHALAEYFRAYMRDVEAREGTAQT